MKNSRVIRQYIDADSFGLFVDPGMMKPLGVAKDFCAACFDGKYPTELY